MEKLGCVKEGPSQAPGSSGTGRPSELGGFTFLPLGGPVIGGRLTLGMDMIRDELNLCHQGPEEVCLTPLLIILPSAKKVILSILKVDLRCRS